MRTLVERSVPLFISAATLYRFISDPQWSPARLLEAILADQTTYTSKMDGIYMPVLNQPLTGQDETESQQLIHEFKKNSWSNYTSGFPIVDQGSFSSSKYEI